MIEEQILAALIADRKCWTQIHEHIERGELTPPSQFWFDEISKYYGSDSGANKCDRSVVRCLGEANLSTNKHRDTYLSSFDAVPETNSGGNVARLVLELKRKKLVYELASELAKPDGGKKSDKLYRELSEVWTTTDLETKQSVKEYAVPAVDLLSKVGDQSRIPIGPKQLRARIGGGALPGHSILIFGRTEVGKSTFVVDMAARAVSKNQKVLYVGNEDSINVMKLRMMQRMLRKTYQEVMATPKASVSAFLELGGEERLRLVHLNPGTMDDLREDIEEFEPTILIVDQIRNFGGRQEDGMTQRMEQNGIKFRSLLGEYGLIGIGVTQAGNRDISHSADTPVWLGTGDVDSSRVGLPATADLMLGIGGNAEMLSRGQRAISIPKNKLAGGSIAREGFICQFDLERGIVS